MANRNFNRVQALEKEEKHLYLEAAVTGGTPGPGPLGIDMGDAEDFAILGASTVTNTGNSVVTGDLGLSPGTSVTGFPPGIVIGTQHITDTAAANAQLALTAAYNDAASRIVDVNYSGTDLGTLTLGPGVYKFNTSAQLTGTLTLDAGGDANAVWIFQIGSTLTTASASSVNIINGGQPGNVYWQVGSSATLGTTTAFKGTIMAQASVTANTGASILGRFMARTAAVSLDTNVVTLAQGTAIPAGASSITRGYGIASLTRDAQGQYTVTLENKYMRLSGVQAKLQNPTAQDLNFQLISEDVATGKTIRFRTMTGAVETDPAPGSKMLLRFDLKNSIVGTRVND